MWGVSLFDQLACRIGFHRLAYEGRYTPPATCGRYCCGWAGAGIGGPGDAPNLACVTRSPNEG